MHSFLMPFVFSWVLELSRRGLLDARAEQGKLTRKLESAAEMIRGNRIFLPYGHQQQSDLINSCCVSSH